MKEATQKENFPPKLRKTASGDIDVNSLADLLEWFLINDSRVGLVRLPQVEELFQWKQQDDKVNGVPIYPFDNAEARFAIGVIQAVEQNENEPLLKLRMSDILGALQEARDAKNELTEAYKLDARPMDTAIQKADKLTTTTERRMYLTSCWLDALLTAEVRVLGWIYQELHGRPFHA